MKKNASITQKRRGRKDDSSLHKFVEQVRRRRESLGLPPPEQDVFDPDAALAEWREEQTILESAVTQETLKDKIRRGVKVDASLHELEREIRSEREAKGLPPEERSINPEKVFTEWRRKHAKTKAPALKKTSANNKRLLRQFTISIEQIPEHGYWAYCSAVNGKRLHGETMAEAWEKMTAYLANHLEKLVAKDKPLPKANTRMKK